MLQRPNTVLLESSRRSDEEHRNFLFHSPVQVLTAHTLEEIPDLFRSMEASLANGQWIAGYFSYECGYHFEKIIPSYAHRSSFPLIWLGVYDQPMTVPPDLLEIEPPSQPTSIDAVRFSIDEATYRHSIETIQRYILNGDTYQVNYTGPMTFSIAGDEIELYFRLREQQHVPFGALLNLGEKKILSFSPELFFRRSGDRIMCKPMKGTSPRGRTTEEDAERIRWLRNDEKNRSENLMIIDLLRNDIGRITETGSVEVMDMYHVEKFETIIQMTSTVTGRLTPAVGYYDIFRSLFPCGSVTGAPKIRTMQIINELEPDHRGVYCGAIGFIAPEHEAVFNVGIRTIETDAGTGRMGIGSGIVYDSDPKKEFDECNLKAKFLLTERPTFHLLETMAWDGEYVFLAEHLSRLKDSAFYFQFRFDEETILSALKEFGAALPPDTQYRIRLRLTKNGTPVIESSLLQMDESPMLIKIADARTDSSDVFFHHKTTHRPLYNRYTAMAKNDNIVDYIFLNEHGNVTEGSIHSIFLELAGKLYTPPCSDGVLAGIYRRHVLTTKPDATEKSITLSELQNADAIYLCNSVRGWRKVTLGA